MLSSERGLSASFNANGASSPAGDKQSPGKQKDLESPIPPRTKPPDASPSKRSGPTGFDLRQQKPPESPNVPLDPKTSRSSGIFAIDLRNTDLSGQDLSRAQLRNADLRGANLRGTILQKFPFRADFKGANLSGTDLSQIVSDRPVGFSAPFNGRGAIYDHQTRFPEGFRPQEEGLICLEAGVDAAGRNLSGLPLSGMKLNGANLSNAGLRNANLRKANLKGANLANAQLQGADMRDIALDDETGFTGATYSKMTRFPSGFNPEQQGMILDNPRPLPANLSDSPDGIIWMDWLPFQA